MGTVAWVVLLGLVVGLELLVPRHSLGAIAAKLGARLPWRIFFVASWCFLGFHLLARHGSPG